MTAVLKALAWILFEVLKYYTPKVKRTTIDSDGVGKREKRLRKKIRERWKNR